MWRPMAALAIAADDALEPAAGAFDPHRPFVATRSPQTVLVTCHPTYGSPALGTVSQSALREHR
jgi:hypothetical protein